jgi:hypothetical protein
LLIPTIGVPILGFLFSGSVGGEDDKFETVNEDVGLVAECVVLPNWIGIIVATSLASSFSLTVGGGEAASGRSLILIIILDIRLEDPEMLGLMFPPKMPPKPSSSEFTKN